MWAAFRLLPLGMKAVFIGGFLALLLAVGGGLYWAGYTKGNNNSKVAIAQYEAKKSDKQNKITTVVGKADVVQVVKYKDRVQIVEHTTTVNHDVIKYRVPEQFHFSNGWVYAYNQSLQGLEIDPMKASDASASWVSDRTGLDYINTNNGIQAGNAVQLDALIDTIHAREEAINEVNK
jgi:hypothetical protein